MPSSWSAAPPPTGSPGSRERDLRVRPALIGPSSAWLSREVQEMAEAWARGDVSRPRSSWRGTPSLAMRPPSG